MNYNFNARGIYFSHGMHGMHGNLSLCDGFLDVLEEPGRCAVLDFVILVFRQGMVAFGILICKDNNFF